tara:strand:+ start:644 stop:1084 length:441 start_codon:yes stop_codon:yes gene_type:complete
LSYYSVSIPHNQRKSKRKKHLFLFFFFKKKLDNVQTPTHFSKIFKRFFTLIRGGSIFSICQRAFPSPFLWTGIFGAQGLFYCLKKIIPLYNQKMNLDLITKFVPLVAGIMYAVVGTAYFMKKDFGWGIIWISYATANFGLMVVGNQ